MVEFVRIRSMAEDLRGVILVNSVINCFRPYNDSKSFSSFRSGLFDK